MKELKITYYSLDDLKPYENNPRLNDNAVDYVANSIREFGFKNPIIIDENNVIIAGHTRYKASLKLNLDKVPCIKVEDLTDEQVKAYRLADNKVSEIALWDIEALNEELTEINIDMEGFGFLDEKVEDDYLKNAKQNNSIVNDFVVFPSTILNSRDSRWIERKRNWISKGIVSEIGRGENLVFNNKISTGTLKGTSIFDPVLCELMYKWFAFKGANVVDTFAGGCVRGAVAGMLGLKYTGIELRKEQVEANYGAFNLDNVRWICDDSLNIDNYVDDGTQDFALLCPPLF